MPRSRSSAPILEGVIGKPITDAELKDGVEVVDENRRLLRELFEYRKETNPRVTGVEALYASLTAQFVDKAEHNEELKRVLAELPKRKNDRPEGIRFMTIGSENDDVSFMAMVESVGSTIVIDDQCSGTRYFWNESQARGRRRSPPSPTATASARPARPRTTRRTPASTTC